jgi:hydroxymethylpyrimidine/phosphomethylpyrimidine kinase
MPIALTIAGFDPSGGAGVLADVKTFAAHGVYGMACITALTVQSTQGVRRVEPVATEILQETLDCLAQDVRFAAIKVGMLGSLAVVEAVLDWLRTQPGVPVVLDPILRSSSGAPLLEPAGLAALRSGWLARADWITPNLAEAAALVDGPIPASPAAMESCAEALQAQAAKAGNPRLGVVLTGGHAERPDDYVAWPGGRGWLPGERVDTTATHGTGCTFSSALTAHLALGMEPVEGARRAKHYVTSALRAAEPIGQGAGPLNHFWATLPFREPTP